jgi:hypothetical protein
MKRLLLRWLPPPGTTSGTTESHHPDVDSVVVVGEDPAAAGGSPAVVPHRMRRRRVGDHNRMFLVQVLDAYDPRLGLRVWLPLRQGGVLRCRELFLRHTPRVP